MTGDECQGLNVALNQATWLDLQVNADTGRAAVLLNVLALPAAGEPSLDNRRWLLLRGVHRVVASLRNGHRDDPGTSAVVLSVEDLSPTVRRLKTPIYGWQFVDPPESTWERWRERLSLDVSIDSEASDHVLQLGAGSAGPVLDVRIWFDTLTAYGDDEQMIPLHQFIADGVRWWEGLAPHH